MAYDPAQKRFQPFDIAPNIHVTVDPQVDALYMLAEDYHLTGEAASGILPGKGVPLVRHRANDDGHLPNIPPEGDFDAVTMTAALLSTADTAFTIRLHLNEAPVRTNPALADASGQAYLQLLDQVARGKRQIDQEISVSFLSPKKMIHHPDGIYMIEPFDPDRIPLLLIHGLRSSPLIWRDLTYAVLTDPVLHRRYQVWHAFYATGMPPFYTASRLRQELHHLLARVDPCACSMASRHMAVTGHSMGGIIARTLVTDDKGLMWRLTFKVPPDKLAVDDNARTEWEGILTLKHEPAIGFAAFLNTPHRGSKTADSLIGRIGSSLISLPKNFKHLFAGGKAFDGQITGAMYPYVTQGGPNSVDVLSPQHPLVAALADLPIADGVEVVSVVGVKKGASCLRSPTCEATDGVVAYQSAHLDQGAELVIQSKHDGYRHPEAIAYLLEKLKTWPPSQPKENRGAK